MWHLLSRLFACSTWWRRILLLLRLVIACKIMSTLVNFYVQHRSWVKCHTHRSQGALKCLWACIEWMNKSFFCRACLLTECAYASFVCMCVCFTAICYWLYIKSAVAVALAVGLAVAQSVCKLFKFKCEIYEARAITHSNTHTHRQQAYLSCNFNVATFGNLTSLATPTYSGAH